MKKKEPTISPLSPSPRHNGCEGCFITLSNGMVALVDPEDFERVNRLKWCSTNKQGNTFYARNGNVKMHRFILGLKKGDSSVDHINRNGLDNRKSNLRFATQRENVWNRGKQKNTTSRFVGVYWDSEKKMWCSRIGRTFLCRTRIEVVAARVYNYWASNMRGEFAFLNKVA